MNWFTKLFGSAVKNGDQKKLNTPLSISGNPSSPEKTKTLSGWSHVQQPDCIGIRFDIDRIDSGGYGEDAESILEAVDMEMVVGTQLLEGDTNDTPDRENVYCLAIRWMHGSGRGEDVRRALDRSSAYRKVASNPDFIVPSQVGREVLD